MTIIGITMGCPAGIGPEIILRAFADTADWTDIQPVVLGDQKVLDKCAAELGLPVPSVAWTPGTPLPNAPAGEVIPVVQVSRLTDADLTWGQPNQATGRAMAHFIETAVQLAQKGLIDGIATCPISKSSLNAAGYRFPGHTEMLAALTNTSSFAMMLAGSRLRVSLVTIHCPLREVAAQLTSQAIYRLIQTTHQALSVDFAIDKPRLAVAGLNPHGGENQLFGSEEERIILPAINQARDEHIEVFGPYPPDTVFYKAASGAFDAVVCMYHDQGLIPFKLLHFKDGVNITLGLPIVRTSVDHGTAYDIAGKGLADKQSLVEAIKLAAMISRNRAAHKVPRQGTTP